MANLHSVKFNAVMNTLLTASSMLVSLITVPYVTRVLSVEGYGDVTFAQSLSTWLSALCLVGVGTYGIRECARVRDDPAALASTVRELLTIVTVCTVVVLGCFTVAIGLIPRLTSLAPLMWMFLVSTLLLSYGVEWYYQAIEQYEYITIRSVAFKFVALAATLLLVQDSGDWLIYGAILALVTCGNNLFNIARLVRTVDWRLAGRLNLRRHLRPLASFACLSIASSFYLNFDSVILGMVSPSNFEVGLYQLAVKIKGVMWSVLNAVLGVLIPRLSNYVGRGDRRNYRDLLAKGSLFTMDVCFALFGYLLVFAAPAAVFVSGESFASAASSIRVIGAVNLLSCLSYLIGLCVLTPLGRERQLAVGNVAGVPVSILLNFLLDPWFGALGAAVSMLCAEAVILGIQAYAARDMLPTMFGWANAAKVVAANTASVVVSLCALRVLGGASDLTVIAASVPCYFGVLLVSLLVLREDGARLLVRMVVKDRGQQ